MPYMIPRTEDDLPLQSPSSPFAVAVSERQRIEAEYNRRARNPALKQLYSPLNPDSLFAIQQRERSLMHLLRKHGFLDLSGVQLLDLGCGEGSSILRWLSYGIQPFNCAGVDLLAQRVKVARSRLPSDVSLQRADATQLPFANASFDLITQETVFSSILDSSVKQRVAGEMLRVLRREGIILWYDFWLNPTNRQTRGIRPAEIRSLFPGCSFSFHRINLAPPIARRLAPFSTLLCEVLERLKIFNSHYMVGIRPL